ncbi:MAG: hypothetical protein IPJ34_41105 [Myxococcales bacterium]|nr:hypothetical protein [Myxococcales bacterium]
MRASLPLLCLSLCFVGNTPRVADGGARVLATIERAVPFAGHVGAGLALEKTATGYRPQTTASTLDATLPPTAHAPAHLGVAGRPRFWVDLAAVDLTPRPAQVVAGAVVFEDAAIDTDVVWVGEAKVAEELRVLRTARAPKTARYHVTRGPEVAAIRVKAAAEPVVEIVDRDGEVRLASAPLFAVDARGVRRAVHAKVEELGGEAFLETSLDTVGLAYPIVVDPAWSTVAPMATARVNHTATTLPGDLVLVAGGVDASGAYLSTVEVFDPKTKTWTATAPLSVPRAQHTATLLSGGRVLLLGGTSNGSTALSTGQLYDAGTKTWTAVAAMSEVRTHHTATLLPGDKVLVTGGSDFGPGTESSAAEIYDAATNKWTATGTMAIGRQEHAATALGGKVLVTGGRRGGGVHHTSADLFDVAAGTWSATGAMSLPRSAHAQALLSGDRVLVTGGRGMDKYGVLQTHTQAELWDPTSKAWKATSAPMALQRHSHTAVPLPLDRVLVVGGPGTANVELYLPTSDRFVTFPTLAADRASPAVAQLSTLDLLVTGGRATTALASAELLTLGALGTGCTDGLTECASGLCVDGVCCNAACDGQCEACDVPTSKGTCTPVVGAPHNARTKCGDGAGSTCQAKHCDGVDRKACAAFADATTVCAAATCADGAAKPDARCDGKGACPAVTATSCAPYACGGAVCKTKCAADADCAGSNVCDIKSGVCVVATATCTADGLSSQPLDRSKPTRACSPYRCDGKTGNCFDRCVDSNACESGAACDTATGTCVGAAAADDGGCALAPRSVGATFGLAALALAALGIAARRRRH